MFQSEDLTPEWMREEVLTGVSTVFMMINNQLNHCYYYIIIIDYYFGS